MNGRKELPFLGQMQMYVHYYERELMNEGDNPPIGIVLCADKGESVVVFSTNIVYNSIKSGGVKKGFVEKRRYVHYR